MSFTKEQIVEILECIKTDLEIQIRSVNEGKGINMGDIIQHCDQLINKVGNSSLTSQMESNLVAFVHSSW